MKELNIFKRDYSDLFTFYGYGVDTIGNILQSIGYNLKAFNNKNAKLEALTVIKELLDYDIIAVLHWGEFNELIEPLNLNTEQTIKYINTLWKEDSEFIDFEGMPMFQYKDWYIKKLDEHGINENTDWNWFSEEFLLEIKKWVDYK